MTRAEYIDKVAESLVIMVALIITLTAKQNKKKKLKQIATGFAGGFFKI